MVTLSDLHSVSISALTERWDDIVLADMVADIEVDMVADMEVDMVADFNFDINIDINMEIQFE